MPNTANMYMVTMFPILKITESFIDDVISKISWHRYIEVYPVVEGRLNADYVVQTQL